MSRYECYACASGPCSCYTRDKENTATQPPQFCPWTGKLATAPARWKLANPAEFQQCTSPVIQPYFQRRTAPGSGQASPFLVARTLSRGLSPWIRGLSFRTPAPRGGLVGPGGGLHSTVNLLCIPILVQLLYDVTGQIGFPG